MRQLGAVLKTTTFYFPQSEILTMEDDYADSLAADLNAVSPGNSFVWAPGNSTLDGGGDGTFLVPTLSSSQVTLTIDSQGDVIVDDGAGDVDTLHQFSTIELGDLTVAISGNVLTETHADGSETVATFNIAGQAYAEEVQDYNVAGVLTETQEFNAFGTLVAQVRGSQYTADFNDDGNSDLFWRSSNFFSSSQTWYSTGAGGYAIVDDGYVEPDWQVAGAGDFNGDGAADLLWRNSRTNDTLAWLSNGAGGFTFEGFGAVGSDWQVAGIGDFNSDGLADILWQNAAGAIELWQTNASGGFFYANLGRIVGWRVASVGDFNADGYSDVLWRNTTTGQAETWLTKPTGGFSYVNDGSPSLQWQIAGTGAFGGKGGGTGDILWRNASSGDAYLYLSNGNGGFTYKDLGVVASDWQVGEIGSFDSNGLSDILWRNVATGADELWLTKAGGGFNYSDLGVIPTDWKIASGPSAV